tara:strand:- start:159 stop:536 length:378 start_codon:yes stop_codon:yes gene_type:complete
MLTLSKFVCPSISISAFASMLPAKVVTPAMFILSNSVCPSTSMSAPISRVENIEVAVVSIPAMLPLPPDAVTVTIPDEIADTSNAVPKSMVPAVPTTEVSSWTTNPNQILQHQLIQNHHQHNYLM